MKLRASISMAAIACAALWGAENFNVRPGQWETTSTTQTTGLPPIPQEVLDRMTPQQRQMMEERMKGNQTPRTTTTKSCVTKEDIEKGFGFRNEDDKACTRTVISSNSSKQEIKIECNRENSKQTGTVKIEASSSDSVKGSGQFTMSSGGRTMTITSNFSSKWLGPACEKEK